MKLLNQTQAKQTIKLIVKGGKALDERIHNVAVSGISHFYEHGDSSTLSLLVAAMPKSGRGNALKYWITSYAPVKYITKTGVYKKNGDMPTDTAAVLEQAMLNPFWNKRDSESASKFDYQARIKGLVTGLTNAIKDHTLKDGTDQTQAKLALKELQGLVA
jgi:hypothetical protein